MRASIPLLSVMAGLTLAPGATTQAESNPGTIRLAQTDQPANTQTQPSASPAPQGPNGGTTSNAAPSENTGGNAAGSESKSAAPNGGSKPFDVKGTFRSICGFCHEDYGRHAGKGPQLMDTQRTDDFIVNRIKHGMPGRMPAFGSVFNDQQIQQIVKFIRALKPGEEPKNPA